MSSVRPEDACLMHGGVTPQTHGSQPTAAPSRQNCGDFDTERRGSPGRTRYIAVNAACVGVYEAGERPLHGVEDFLLNSVKDVWGELRIVGLGVPKYGSHFAQRSVRHVDWEHGVGTQKRLVNDVALPVQSMRVR